MQITYKNKKMIVAHPSGVISELAVEDLQRLKTINYKRISDLTKMNTELDQQIAKIDASTSDS